MQELWQHKYVASAARALTHMSSQTPASVCGFTQGTSMCTGSSVCLCLKSAQRGLTQRAFEITFSPENKEGSRSRYRALAARHKIQELISLGIKVFLTRLMLVILGCLLKRDIKGAARIWTKVSSAASGKFQEIFHDVEVNVCNTKP